ncbi:MAG TPA: hypothetical protein GX497_01460 [Bacillus bacterium]|nr:hypothetical protein [Bacillus sp. (in: firmicutes)]
MTITMDNQLYKVWEKDPLLPFYNINGLEKVILTCDIDWAPDFAIEYVMNLVEKYDCKITMFSTHKSELLLNAPEFVEVGLHPDFTRPNNQSGFGEKLFKLKEIYPNAVGTRSHRNFFGQNIADIAKQYDLQYDASVFLWNQPLCQVHKDYNNMLRFSYMWEDGIHLDMGLPFSWESISLSSPGLKIVNIHPILIYLNSVNEQHRRSVTSRYSDLTIASKSEIDVDVNKSYGIRDFWEELLKYINENSISTYTLSDVANYYREQDTENN